MYSLFERGLVLVDLFAGELLELEEHVFGADAPEKLRHHRLAVLQRIVDLLPPVQHGRKFTLGRFAGRSRFRRGRRRRRSHVHRTALSTTHCPA